MATSKSKTSAGDEADTATQQSEAPAIALYILAPIDPQAPPFYMAHVPALMIVAAGSPEQARTIANAAAAPIGAECWLDAGLSFCDVLAPTEPGLLAQDFVTSPPPREAATPITTPPINLDAPYLAGAGIVGETLTCTMGNWEGEPTSYVYAWATDGAPNSAAGDSYTVVPGDVGHEITCVVTATNELGSTQAPPSNGVIVSDGA
jgi:hypothetical protein